MKPEVGRILKNEYNFPIRICWNRCIIHIMTFLRSLSKEFEMPENKSYQEKISYIEKVPKRVPIQRLPKGRQTISQIYTNGLGLQKSKKICFVSTPCTFFHYNVS